MKQYIIDVFFALLRFEIKGTALCEDVKKNIHSETLKKLYKISKKHDLAHLIGDALDKNGLLPIETDIDKEIRKRFLQERNMAVYRVEQLQYELDCICETLKKANIPFIPLKGAFLRSLYAEPWMRTSCDIDILVEEKNLQKAIGFLEKELSYQCTEIGQHDAQIFAENGTHIELHYSLLESGSKQAVRRVLDCIWESVNMQNVQCEMPDELLYCYHISHIAKHIKFGGCGVRAILDTWILNHKVEFDKAKRDRLLQKAGLFSAAKAIENLAEVWFLGAEKNALSEELEEYILTGGVYGTFENKVAAQQTRQKNKVVYLCSRIFIPYSEMKFKYPILQKYSILYPFYIVKRCFLLLNKDKRKFALQEVKQTTNRDNDKQKRIARLLKDLDL